MPCIHSDIVFEVQTIKKSPLLLLAHHSSLVHHFNSLPLIGAVSAVLITPFLQTAAFLLLPAFYSSFLKLKQFLSVSYILNTVNLCFCSEFLFSYFRVLYVGNVCCCDWQGILFFPEQGVRVTRREYGPPNYPNKAQWIGLTFSRLPRQTQPQCGTQRSTRSPWRKGKNTTNTALFLKRNRI